MQSKTTRGVRHLLVSTGVISLVLSVAAPAALADKPADVPGNGSPHADNVELGTTRVLICHNGQVLEVDDDSVLGGHGNHDDDVLGHPDDPEIEAAKAGCVRSTDDETQDDDEDDDIVVEVCRAGELVQVPLEELGEDEVGSVPSELGSELVCDVEDDDDAGEDVAVCHEGKVLTVPADALEAHVGHGDEELGTEVVDGTDCGETPVIVDEDEIIEDDVPIVVQDPTSGDEPVVVVIDDSEAPVRPVPPVQPRPVVVISTDAVTKPVVATPATPAAPAAAPAVTQASGNEVLGAVTTRIPTAGGATALAATGSGTTWMLVALGLTLLLAGFGLQVGARRVRPADLTA